MRIRAISSIWVVIIGLVPAVLGGPPFALLMAILGLLGYREYLQLAQRLDVGQSPMVGYWVVVAFALTAALTQSVVALAAVVSGAIFIPIAAVLIRPTPTDGFLAWSVAATGSLYVGMPLFAAVSVRQLPGVVDAAWLSGLAEALAVGWSPQPRGLAWLLIVILATWLGDTGAYVVGRTWGRHRLIPRVSPNKTWEGAAGGLAGAALAGGIGVALFGLEVPLTAGLIVGGLLGAVGQIGDLTESYLKRQAGVKDSGSIIPGHGGMLDRIDALLFALPFGWFLSHLVDRFIA